jgi:hypothetical protein
MRRSTLTGRIIMMAALVVTAIIGMSNATQAQTDTCCTAEIINTTNCPVRICIRSMAGQQCADYAANSVQSISVPCVAFHVWVRTCNNTWVMIPLGQCVDPVVLQGGCCAKICFTQDPVTFCYTITVEPSLLSCACP